MLTVYSGEQSHSQLLHAKLSLSSIISHKVCDLQYLINTYLPKTVMLFIAISPELVAVIGRFQNVRWWHIIFRPDVHFGPKVKKIVYYNFLEHHTTSFILKWNAGVLDHFFALWSLNWAGDSLGLMRWNFYETCPGAESISRPSIESSPLPLDHADPLYSEVILLLHIIAAVMMPIT